MEETSNRIHTKLQNPLLQVAVILVLILLANAVAKMVQVFGFEVEQRLPWTISTTFILFFAVLNALMSLSSGNLEKYWGRSILAYLFLAGGAALMAWLFSSLSIDEAGPYRWIYIVLTFGYLFFLSLIGFIKKIVDYAQKEEWNNPKIRKHKK